MFFYLPLQRGVDGAAAVARWQACTGMNHRPSLLAGKIIPSWRLSMIWARRKTFVFFHHKDRRARIHIISHGIKKVLTQIYGALALDHDSTKLSKCAQEHWICFLCTFLPLHILVVVFEWQMFWNCAKWPFLWQPVTMLDSYPMLWNIPFHAKGNQLWYVSCGSTVTWPK